mgnify:FL=1
MTLLTLPIFDNRMETSAKDDININKAAHLLVSHILARIEQLENQIEADLGIEPCGKHETNDGSCCVA